MSSSVGAEGVRLLDGDDTLLADLVDRLGDERRRSRGRRRRWIAVAAISSLVSISLALATSSVVDGRDGLLDAALQADRVGAGRDVAQAFADERLGEHDRGGRSVTGDVIRLLGDLLDELRADLLVRVVEFDLLGDRDTVVRDGGGAPLLLENDVATARAERDLDGVGQDVEAALEAATGLFVESNDLCHGYVSSLPDEIPR